MLTNLPDLLVRKPFAFGNLCAVTHNSKPDMTRDNIRNPFISRLDFNAVFAMNFAAVFDFINEHIFTHNAPKVSDLTGDVKRLNVRFTSIYIPNFSLTGVA